MARFVRRLILRLERHDKGLANHNGTHASGVQSKADCLVCFGDLSVREDSADWTVCGTTTLEIEPIDVALVEDERRAQTHFIVGDFNLSQPAGRQFMITTL